MIDDTADTADTGDVAEHAPLLSIRDVRFSYEKNGPDVLGGVSLSLGRGRCLCLMGVNGCGKSTLLDCVLGVHRVSGGDVLIDGRSIARMRPAQAAKLVSYVPQVQTRTFPYPVDHVVLMGRTVHAKGLGAPDFADREIALQALRQCGIAHLADRPYTSLPDGYRVNHDGELVQ